MICVFLKINCMKTQLKLLAYFFLGIFAFDTLFWEQKLGLNLPIFTFLGITISLFLNKESFQKNKVLYSLTAVFISGIMVVWNNTGWSIFMHFLSVFISFGFIKQTKITTVFEGLIGFLVSYVTAPVFWLKSLNQAKKNNRLIAFSFSFIKLCIIPLVLFFLFFTIYKDANPKFNELTLSFSQLLSEWMVGLNFPRLLFLFFGFTILLLVFREKVFQIPAFVAYEDNLVRRKRKIYHLTYQGDSSPLSDLLNEKKVGLLIFAVLNALLLCVNLIDINWIWFDFEVPLEFNLKQFVHEGTYLLIFSILLSMGIFLYFFRGSLNFYPKNKWLRLFGKLWIIQNIILTLSVFLRNYHYIDYHGLAGKRIGVVAFLVVTVFGLISLIIKVNKLKTTAYLVRKNGCFILFIMVLMSCLNWDRVIVNYNLNHGNTGEIDVDYYLDLSPSVAPILLKNLETIQDQMIAHKSRENKVIWLNNLDIEHFKEVLEYRTSQYLQKQEEYNWQSWNRSDWRLKKRTVLIPSD